MECNEIRDNLSLYIDDELSEEEKKALEEHLDNCPECRKELEEYRIIIKAINELPDEEPPAGYCKRLHEKLLEAEKDVQDVQKEEKTSKTVTFPSKSRGNKFRWVKYGGLAAALVLVFLVYGNSRGMMKNSSNKMAEQAPMAPAESPSSMRSDSGGGESTYFDMAESPEEYYAADQENNAKMEEAGIPKSIDFSQQMTALAAAPRELKIIKSGSIYTQTKDYEKFSGEIAAKIGELGGYIESSSTAVYQIYGDEKLMRGNLKIRVPQESFYETVSYLEQNSEISHKNINEKDATKEYYEKDNKVKNLEIQEQNLRALFEKATTVEEMLQIENELRRIRTEIDEINISLSDINDRSSMSTIDLEVEEVRNVSFAVKGEKGVWERARDGFISTVNSMVRGFGNFIVNIVSSSPVLIPVIVIFLILLLKIKKYWKKKI